MIKVIKGKLEGIRIVLELPDDAPDGEKIGLIRELQKFVDRFDSEDEFNEVMSNVAATEITKNH